MNPDLTHLSANARYDLLRMGDEIQQIAQRRGQLHRKEAEAAGVFLAVYRLGVAIENYSKLNGHLGIVATFTPLMPFFPEDENVNSNG